jgi:alanyl-tRNA synthetase
MEPMPSSLTVKEIKQKLLKFHKDRGYRIFDSFPLISNDPTVMFINATITPFKSWFTDKSVRPQNFALIQGCLRTGGASDIEVVGVNPYYFTFFEMFGSGTFNITHTEAVAYLLELLAFLGIEKEHLYFTIPVNEEFYSALRLNKVEEDRIFKLEKNGYFWQEWRFGVPGPIGHGITVIFAHSSQKVKSIEELAGNPNQYVELLNLIYVHSQTLPDGKLLPVPNPGFDLGIGIERLAAVLQGCDCYHIDTISPLLQIVKDFLLKNGIEPNDTIVRICVDHFRAIYILLSEGVIPSNKKHGYVLRKLIRRFFEFIWSTAGYPISIDELIQSLSSVLKNQGFGIVTNIESDILEKIKREEVALLNILQRVNQIIQRHHNISPQILYSTYGISEKLRELAERKSISRK